MTGYNKLREYAKQQLNNGLSVKLNYHSIEHTIDVLRKVNFLLQRKNHSNHEKKLIRIAALFHDIGFINTYKDHEEESVRILKSAMQVFNCNMDDFNILESLIMATKIPQKPQSSLEEIICDADLFYLGESRYYPVSELLFEEWKNYGLIENQKDWISAQLNFLRSHHFHTDYGKKVLKPEKLKRIKELEAKSTS